MVIPIPPPEQSVRIVDYAGEEFIPAGRGLKEGLEIERVQADLAPEYEEAPVRVVKPNLLFCVHQRNSEGVGWGEGECWGLCGS